MFETGNVEVFQPFTRKILKFLIACNWENFYHGCLVYYLVLDFVASSYGVDNAYYTGWSTHTHIIHILRECRIMIKTS